MEWVISPDFRYIKLVFFFFLTADLLRSTLTLFLIRSQSNEHPETGQLLSSQFWVVTAWSAGGHRLCWGGLNIAHCTRKKTEAERAKGGEGRDVNTECPRAIKESSKAGKF